ncbi:collagen-like protein [Sesbania bispinosa]|nr:collagen-like protein [Sesbania bispinosa]
MDEGDAGGRGDDGSVATKVTATTSCSSKCSTSDKGNVGDRGDDGSIATEVTMTTGARPGTAELLVAEATTKVLQ